jgi:hypothetical protein
MDDIAKKTYGGGYGCCFKGDYHGDGLKDKNSLNPLNWFKKK